MMPMKHNSLTPKIRLSDEFYVLACACTFKVHAHVLLVDESMVSTFGYANTRTGAPFDF